MTLSDLLPSLAADTTDRLLLWPRAVHSHGGRLTVRSEDATSGSEWFLDELCDRYGDSVVVDLPGAVPSQVCVSRVRGVSYDAGVVHVALSGTATGTCVAAARIASRHSSGRRVPVCLCTGASACLCPAIDLPADVRVGDVVAVVTGCGRPALVGRTWRPSR